MPTRTRPATIRTVPIIGGKSLMLIASPPRLPLPRRLLHQFLKRPQPMPRPGTGIPFPIVRGESPRGLDTELYGETNEKDSWGPRSLWPTHRFRVNSREVRLPDMFRASTHISGNGVYQDLAQLDT